MYIRKKFDRKKYGGEIKIVDLWVMQSNCVQIVVDDEMCIRDRNYIVEEKDRVPSEKRWNSSQGLRDPRIKVVHSKRPAAGGSYKKIGSFVDGMVKDRDSIPEILKKWYPDMDFTNANVYYNDFNCMFYIHARMRKRRLQSEKTEKTGKTCRTT